MVIMGGLGAILGPLGAIFGAAWADLSATGAPKRVQKEPKTSPKRLQSDIMLGLSFDLAFGRFPKKFCCTSVAPVLYCKKKQSTGKNKKS